MAQSVKIHGPIRILQHCSFTTQPGPVAEVQHWNAESVFAKCPFCTKIHQHPFSTSDTAYIPGGVSYISVCKYNPSASSRTTYRLEYPFPPQSSTITYEINKSTGLFIRLGAFSLNDEARPLEESFGDLGLRENQPKTTRSWDEATEMIGIDNNPQLTKKRLDYMISQMRQGGSKDPHELGSYLENSTKAELFLQGVDEHGNSALIIAARDANTEAIRLLLDHNADPNHQNENGKTALMEAALWGRTDNVKHLLKHGADKYLYDNNRHQAGDLASPSQENEEERYKRSCEEGQLHREIPFLDNQARREICELLKDPRSVQYTTGYRPAKERDFELHSFTFNPTTGTMTLVAPMAKFRTGSATAKTMAWLERSSGFAHVVAMSGWKHEGTLSLIPGKKWTGEAMKLSKIVGYELETNSENDGGVSGQFSACHAEKQLIAYFVNKHVLIEGEDSEILLRAKPPFMPKEATILVSGEICDDCRRFVTAVNRFLGLRITVFERPMTYVS